LTNEEMKTLCSLNRSWLRGLSSPNDAGWSPKTFKVVGLSEDKEATERVEGAEGDNLFGESVL
jgi:hypothetical protein